MALHPPILIADLAQYGFGIVLFFTAFFLIVLILLQRGKGGGLVGALGGMGGSSAFGAKAGDKVMWTTVAVAFGWILICMLAGVSLQSKDEFDSSQFSRGVMSSEATPSPRGSETAPQPEPTGGARDTAGETTGGVMEPPVQPPAGGADQR